MKAKMKQIASKAVKGHEDKMHKGKKYAAGGMTGLDRAAAMSGRAMPAMPVTGRRMKKGGDVKEMAKGGKVGGCGMAKGGKVRGCGVAKKGTSKAKMY